jgi:hypothetical protein
MGEAYSMVRNALAFAVLVVALVAAGCVTDAYSRAGGPGTASLRKRSDPGTMIRSLQSL